eukprot:TRINITY_DN105348_c0_g1_i1.p1 TRINITY_DN105348_c0_g1~~TRINITY_DN105348_c0_g1_i1.p1  ORF type:complete len:479 (-),score=118.36 TRINITY_DN105348_c0_g1_i1:78-1514(-)
MEAILRLVFGKVPAKEKRLYSVMEQLHAQTKEDVMRVRKHLGSWKNFNAVIVCTILLNTIIIGLEVDMVQASQLENRLVFFIMELIFTLVFLVEMGVRLNQYAWDYFVDPWNIFDYALVILSCSDVVMSLADPNSPGMGLASTLRIFRLLRVVRSIKGVHAIAGLWLIIQGLLESLKTVIWVAMAMIVFLYCFGVALVTLAGQEVHIRELWLEAEIYIGTTPKAMMSMLQVVTFDRWAQDVVRPLIKLQPLALIVIFGAIIVMSFGCLNILVAVMVAQVSAISKDGKMSAAKEREQTEQSILAAIIDELKENDDDGSGDLDFKEFKKLIRLPSLKSKLQLLGLRIDEAEGLFTIMDVDESGTVTPEEFIDGLQKVKGAAKGQDVLQLIGFAQKHCSRAAEFVERLSFLNGKADEIQERCNKLGLYLQAEVQDRSKAERRADQTWQAAAKRTVVIKKVDLDRQKNFPGLAEVVDQSSWI